MAVERVEVDRHIYAGYKTNDNAHAFFTFIPGQVNEVPVEIWERLRANKDSQGNSPIDRYLDAKWMTWLSRNAKGGLAPAEKAPIQAVAEALAKGEPVPDVAPRKRGRPPKVVSPEDREHGVAYDEGDLTE